MIMGEPDFCHHKTRLSRTIYGSLTIDGLDMTRLVKETSKLIFGLIVNPSQTQAP